MNQEFWSEMRTRGAVVVDAPARKIAIFPNDSGMVVIAIQADGIDCVTALQLSEVGPAVAALLEAEHDAAPVCATLDAQYNAYVAIEKARS